MNERLRVKAHVGENGVENTLGTVDLHPEGGYHRKRHYDRHEERYLEIFFAVGSLVDKQRQSQRSQTLNRNDYQHEFHSVEKRLNKQFVSEYLRKVLKSNKVSCVGT